MQRSTGVITVVALLALGACTNTHASEPEERRVAGVVTRGRFELAIYAKGTEPDVSLRASGAFDDARQRFVLSIDASLLVPGIDGNVEVVQLPDRTFVRCSYLARLLDVATPWMVVQGPPGSWLADLRPALDELVAGGTVRFDAPGDVEHAQVSVRYLDPGAPVVIEPPPAEDVTDVTEAMSRLSSREPGG